MIPFSQRIIDGTLSTAGPVCSPSESKTILKSAFKKGKPLRFHLGQLGGNISTKRDTTNPMADKGINEEITPSRGTLPRKKDNVMSRAQIVRSIDAPAEEVWKTLCEFNRVEKFLPEVAACTVYGSGIGARRVCILQDGSKVFERLVTLDEKERMLRYSVTQSLLPFESYLGTITVRDLGNRKCQIDWSSTFDPIGMPEAQVISMIEFLYSESIEGLEKLHGVDTSR